MGTIEEADAKLNEMFTEEKKKLEQKISELNQVIEQNKKTEKQYKDKTQNLQAQISKQSEILENEKISKTL